MLAYPDAVVLPGLVNVHTHLELTAFRGQVLEHDFVAWIQHVRRLKERTTVEGYLAAARAGVREAWRHGTTTVADTGTSGATVAALRELGGRGVYYHEVIAPHPSAAAAVVAALEVALVALGDAGGVGVRLGVSPHAPYTVSPTLLQRSAAAARSAGYPLAMHVAESEAESRFIRDGAGPFAGWWRWRGIPLPPRAPSPVDYLARLGLLGPDFLAIHVVQVNEADVALLRRAGAAVAACPRSNRRHGHGAPPLAALLAAGIRVGLGTDSVASVDSLDLFAEARVARELAGCTPRAAMALATIDGARALGLESEIGSLEPGKWADLCVVTGPSCRAEAAAADGLLATRPADVLATYVGGRPVYQRGAATSDDPRQSVVETPAVSDDLPGSRPASR